MSSEVIFMPLENEGTDVWAPVQAERLTDGRFRLLGSQPEDQEWRFAPGSIVAVQRKVFSGGSDGLVIVAISNETRPSAGLT
jgi:hypothetical protein